MGSFFMLKNSLSENFDAYANDPHHDDYAHEEVDKYSCGCPRKEGWDKCPICFKPNINQTLNELRNRKTNRI
jgi:hypothetical protein